jgi:hypothetical protein
LGEVQTSVDGGDGARKLHVVRLHPSQNLSAA